MTFPVVIGGFSAPGLHRTWWFAELLRKQKITTEIFTVQNASKQFSF